MKLKCEDKVLSCELEIPEFLMEGSKCLRSIRKTHGNNVAVIIDGATFEIILNVTQNHECGQQLRKEDLQKASDDILMCKLWYGMVLIRSDYAACLRTVNDVLSRISPYALYTSHCLLRFSRESKSIYEHLYLQSTVRRRHPGKNQNFLASGSAFL